ncbi:TIGR03668 family PPOX class F420-dependent oxidoreductase [Cryptosporangium phraense]|uniref:TIGR03668 family PPOX class F420-dependent oxidoreductase n=1 Tax=Cryptosporangium phraense TaxID=2593070 RepID=A0A545ATR2_9ACTN|nr:TIGR03668 family PPOX class F420-dependent oxidoreductase [Cryptosporangium phraense]TQS44729.1 TIGR03668 family PPOX class F420-dependent oxidoreductase [Cryptosporangium phraense]
MQLSAAEARRRLTGARVVRLATADAAGVPHLVPATFAVVGETVLIAVDAKPKRHTRLKRLANIAENPRVSLLADHYDDDWEQLWWARADGTARVLDVPAPDPLVAKYPQYRERRPGGPMIEIEVTRWSGWSYSGIVD